MEWLPTCEKLEKAVGGRYWLDMMIVYCQKLAGDHQDFANRVSRLIGVMNEACSDRMAFVRGLHCVPGEIVSAKTIVFLEEMMNKEGNKEWQLRGLEKEAIEMVFEIESFFLKLMDEEPSHKHKEEMELESTQTSSAAKLPTAKLPMLNKDAKTLFAAIETRFGGNEATKKTQKTLLKQLYKNFSAISTESLDSIFNRHQKINIYVVVWRNKSDLDTMSIDDLYNNFKIV
nr:hypothetical protein [Tanacetum cinerariifolium]